MPNTGIGINDALVASVVALRGRREHFGKKDRRRRHIVAVITSGAVNDDIGLAQRLRTGVQSEFRNHGPLCAIKPVAQKRRDVHDEHSMCARYAGHHHNTTSGEFAAI